MNAITKRQYDVLKNDRSFTVITFNRETGKRLLTYSGLDLFSAMRETLLKQWGTDVLIIRNVKPGDACMPTKADYVARYKDQPDYLTIPRADWEQP